jgi:hypothetical protein
LRVSEPEGQTQKVGRRRFLRGVGLGGAATALGTVLPAARAGARSEVHAATDFKQVWRLSNEGEKSCRACRHHDRHRYYRRAKFARHDRPHVHCNCDVIRQLLPAAKWKTFFVRQNGDLRRVWDTRWKH